MIAKEITEVAKGNTLQRLVYVEYISLHIIKK